MIRETARNAILVCLLVMWLFEPWALLYLAVGAIVAVAFLLDVRLKQWQEIGEQWQEIGDTWDDIKRHYKEINKRRRELELWI